MFFTSGESLSITITFLFNNAQSYSDVDAVDIIKFCLLIQSTNVSSNLDILILNP